MDGMKEEGRGREIKALQKVYRFFKERKHAESLLNGTVWISTIEECRKYEHPLQGDKEEGFITYHSGRASQSDGDDIEEIGRRAGILITDSYGGVIENATHRTRVKDAYVLCTTAILDRENLSGTFGEYCVEIRNPYKLHQLMAARMAKLGKLMFAGVMKVRYCDREYSGMEDAPSLILGQVKPKVPYAPQKEVRFMWHFREPWDYKPFGLWVPEAVALCRLVT